MLKTKEFKGGRRKQKRTMDAPSGKKQIEGTVNKLPWSHTMNGSILMEEEPTDSGITPLNKRKTPDHGGRQWNVVEEGQGAHRFFLQFHINTTQSNKINKLFRTITVTIIRLNIFQAGGFRNDEAAVLLLVFVAKSLLDFLFPLSILKGHLVCGSRFNY